MGKRETGKKPPDSAFKTRRIEVEAADEGGFIVTRSYREVVTDGRGHYKEPTRHVYKNREELTKALGNLIG